MRIIYKFLKIFIFYTNNYILYKFLKIFIFYTNNYIKYNYMSNSNRFKSQLDEVKSILDEAKEKLTESINTLITSNYSNESIENNKQDITEKLIELVTLMNDIIENKSKKLSINLPKGFKFVKQPGDGTCLYHSIVTSLTLRNIKTNYKFRNGFHLKKFLVESLNNIEKEFTKNSLETNNIENGQNAVMAVHKASLKSLFLNLSDLNKDKNGTYYDIYYKKNILERIKILKSRINDTKLWGSSPELILISFIFQICIYLWDTKTKNWLIYRYEHLASCNLTNSIFILYNGIDHYDCLLPLPTDINKFNKNFPMNNPDVTKYSFIKNKVNKPVKSETKTSNSLFNFSNKENKPVKSETKTSKNLFNFSNYKFSNEDFI